VLTVNFYIYFPTNLHLKASVAMASPVAIVTGGSSGIGLALVQHLISLKWHVVVADLNPPKVPLPSECTLFIPADIASWEQQAAMFQRAYQWGQRLDACVLNAGVDDRDDIFSTLSLDPMKPPKRPNTLTFDVNITGTYVLERGEKKTSSVYHSPFSFFPLSPPHACLHPKYRTADSDSNANMSLPHGEGGGLGTTASSSPHIT
jgi:hypothetical protein